MSGVKGGDVLWGSALQYPGHTIAWQWAASAQPAKALLHCHMRQLRPTAADHH